LEDLVGDVLCKKYRNYESTVYKKIVSIKENKRKNWTSPECSNLI